MARFFRPPLRHYQSLDLEFFFYGRGVLPGVRFVDNRGRTFEVVDESTVRRLR